MILEEGIENVWNRHRIHAHCVWAAVDAWSVVGEVKCLIPNAADRSLAVTAISTAVGDAIRLRQWCEQQVGVTLGVGLGASATRGILDNVFRIGHMGHLNPPTLLGVLACVDAGLKSLDIPHGPSALDAATQVLSESI
jgi:alanine-glyoxylate transaminase/serine-glyoxylate transaminase/serine-pyruvate transaminase